MSEPWLRELLHKGFLSLTMKHYLNRMSDCGGGPPEPADEHLPGTVSKMDNTIGCRPYLVVAFSGTDIPVPVFYKFLTYSSSVLVRGRLVGPALLGANRLWGLIFFDVRLEAIPLWLVT